MKIETEHVDNIFI